MTERPAPSRRRHSLPSRKDLDNERMVDLVITIVVLQRRGARAGEPRRSTSSPTTSPTSTSSRCPPAAREDADERRRAQTARGHAARPAATVVILRDGPDGLEVFMVVRHHEIDFASGALVFPGGKVEPQDADPAWAELAPRRRPRPTGPSWWRPRARPSRRRAWCSPGGAAPQPCSAPRRRTDWSSAIARRCSRATRPSSNSCAPRACCSPRTSWCRSRTGSRPRRSPSASTRISFWCRPRSRSWAPTMARSRSRASGSRRGRPCAMRMRARARWCSRRT